MPQYIQIRRHSICFERLVNLETFNPLRIEYFCGVKQIWLHFLSLLDIQVGRVVETIPGEKIEFVHYITSML